MNMKTAILVLSSLVLCVPPTSTSLSSPGLWALTPILLLVTFEQALVTSETDPSLVSLLC